MQRTIRRGEWLCLRIWAVLAKRSRTGKGVSVAGRLDAGPERHESTLTDLEPLLAMMCYRHSDYMDVAAPLLRSAFRIVFSRSFVKPNHVLVLNLTINWSRLLVTLEDGVYFLTARINRSPLINITIHNSKGVQNGRCQLRRRTSSDLSR